MVRLFESMRNQTVGVGWEAIFVDDHSVDHTIDTILSNIKLDAFRPPDPRFKFFVNPQKGAGSARNYGMKQSVGKYLWFIDSDDYIPNRNAFKIIIDAIRANPDVDLFTVNCAAVDGVGRKIKNSFTNLRAAPELYAKVLTSEDFVKNFEALYSTIGFPPWNKVVRRKFLDDNRICFQNTLFCNDQYFSIRCMSEAKAIFMIPNTTPMYCWLTAGRYHTTGSSLKKSHPEQYAIVLEGLDKNCRWPNDEIRKKILEDRSEQFNCDVLRKSGRL